MTSADPATWNAGDFHQWTRPPSTPCPGCSCCTATLCATAAARELPCVAVGRSADYDLDRCPCANLAAAHRQLTTAAASDPSNPANAGRWTTDEAEWLYRQRNGFLVGAAHSLARAGVPVGITRDPADPHPVVLTIDLPDAGQVTWHLPDHDYRLPPAAPWDGHDTTTKYARLTAWLAANTPTTTPATP
ncbi:hypothetical protein AB0B88_15890 [Micromonospora haikouensis]|uniref:hypothetical protein n=1 Tax=Micromonospora haikouensis TaxID=686309 RepID=UPI00340276C7